MDETKKQAVSPDVQENENKQGKEQEVAPETSPVSKEEQPQQKQEQIQAPKEAEAEGSAVEAEKKPTRLEKRIKSLEEKKQGIEEVLGKLKQSGATQVGKQDVPNFLVGGDEPLIKPEELEEGVDPQELERRVQTRLEKAKQEAIQQAVEQVQYQTVVKEHLADVETAPERYPELNPKSDSYDPDFEQEVARLYELYNTVYNPLTGQKELVPAVKMSEVVKEVKQKWEKIGQKQAGQLAGRLAEQVGSSAVAPSASTGESEVSLEELKKNIWKNPRAVAEKLAKKLQVEE